MATFSYPLDEISILTKLFPPAKSVNPDVGLTDLPSVIAHYSKNSLLADAFTDVTAQVEEKGGAYVVTVTSSEALEELQKFAYWHQKIFGPEAGGKAIVGMEMMKDLGVWNPMSGFPVNDNPDDGRCKWHLFPPLGLNVMGQRGLLLMHYPPWQVLQQATFLDVMTMARWNTVLKASGVPEDEVSFYRTFIDVNPIAAPGEGQSEYPNDYFPIMMSSAFFDGPGDRNYIRTMLNLYLNGPQATGSQFTLPLLICGSPLYDPQAPGWFRVAYKNDLPVDKNGTPTVDVLQAGKVKFSPDSARETPYLIANHMIAAGVTGRCTDDPAEIPDIRKYEAQDLVAALFLYEYSKNPDLDPQKAKRRACQRWFGNDDGSGAPNPSKEEDRQIICALAQMDLFFVPGPPPHPRYTFQEAMKRCASADNKPCCPPIGPEKT